MSDATGNTDLNPAGRPRPQDCSPVERLRLPPAGGSRPGATRALLLSLALMVASPAAAQVRVRYAPIFGFSDIGSPTSAGISPRGTLRELAQIIEDLGRARLRSGETLDVTVLDVNRAGFQRGPSVADGPRIVSGATPPRIRLAYVLRSNGRIVAQDEEELRNPNFLLTGNPRASSGPLYYERELLRDWFDDRFRYRLRRRSSAG